MSQPIIALLTDFGLSDPYAGIMKGVILARAPDAHIVDLTHEVPTQGVEQAAYLLQTAIPYFPPGTIFVVVVDPGVGTSRRRIAIEADGRFFIGPDNGCLSAALPDAVRGFIDAGDEYQARTVLLPDANAYELTQGILYGDASPTFEGRDVFAPAAALLVTGTRAADMGVATSQMLAFQAFRAPIEDGRASGRVIHVDSFGNLITDIRQRDISGPASFSLGKLQIPLVRTYSDVREGDLLALIGSSGYVEICRRGGDAAREIGVGMGVGYLVEQV